MVYKGIVKNGVVVLEDGKGLSDGALVRVEPISEESTDKDNVESIFRMAERAKPTGIHDLAINHDHYLYGHPKVTDG
jgi:hypothetical protein